VFTEKEAENMRKIVKYKRTSFRPLFSADFGFMSFFYSKAQIRYSAVVCWNTWIKRKKTDGRSKILNPKGAKPLAGG